MHYKKHLPLVILVTWQSASVAGQAINCEGSYFCTRGIGQVRPTLDDLIQITDLAINDGGLGYLEIPEKKMIACAWGYCAFFQFTNDDRRFSQTLGYANMKLKQLKEIDCKDCGSAPIGPHNENVRSGGLTVNWVHDVCECNPMWKILDGVGGAYCLCDAYSLDDKAPHFAAYPEEE